MLNVDPELINVQLSADEVEEGRTIRVTGSVADQSPNDTFTLVISWGDGTQTRKTLLGPGSYTIDETHLYKDDNPTGTPRDAVQVVVAWSTTTAASRRDTGPDAGQRRTGDHRAEPVDGVGQGG